MMITLKNTNADMFVPDGSDATRAMARTTHLGVGAHQDDLEIMAAHGILECYQRDDRFFSGITCTNGSGSSRTGLYSDFTDEEMMAVRAQEQRKAATLGEYGFMAQLGYSSSQIKDPANSSLADDLEVLLKAARPKVIYTHNPADKHESHIASFANLLKALRRLPESMLPDEFYGCEVWRDLDWMDDGEKIAFEVGERAGLTAALVGLFDSQIAGGKRYDQATLGRRHANATYFSSHESDAYEAVVFAMDLMPLLRNKEISPVELVKRHIHTFENDVTTKLNRHFGE
jgi:LmbE family N-acetylglucosaminyl deacetylase